MFAAFAGEPWGYMGSKRFLWELHSRENSTKPLTLEAIDQVGPLCPLSTCLTWSEDCVSWSGMTGEPCTAAGTCTWAQSHS